MANNAELNHVDRWKELAFLKGDPTGRGISKLYSYQHLVSNN